MRLLFPLPASQSGFSHHHSESLDPRLGTHALAGSVRDNALDVDAMPRNPFRRLRRPSGGDLREDSTRDLGRAAFTSQPEGRTSAFNSQSVSKDVPSISTISHVPGIQRRLVKMVSSPSFCGSGDTNALSGGHGQPVGPTPNSAAHHAQQVQQVHATRRSAIYFETDLDIAQGSRNVTHRRWPHRWRPFGRVRNSSVPRQAS